MRRKIKIEKLDEAVKYFNDNKGYVRLLKGIKSKYISLGEIKGNIIITNPSEEERQALSGLMKKDYSRNKTINVNLNKLNKILKDTRFSELDLKDIVEKYFGQEIITKKEERDNYQQELSTFFEMILAENKGTYIYSYLKDIIEEKKHVYYNLKKYYNKNKILLEQSLRNACIGINNIPNKNTRIPVFANNVINDPHGYDRKNLCGIIFIMLLSYINNVPKPKNSEELAELYYNNHLLVDDISNMVLCRNISGYSENKIIHRGLEGFKHNNEPIYLTIYNLSNIKTVKNKYNSVLIMENPAVFMEITEKCPKKDFPIVCTYGQIKLAGIMLLDMLVEAGFKLFYSGDIDPEGIQIADKLKQRYGNNLKFIGFDIETYLKNASNIKICNARINKLEHIKSIELQAISQKLRENKTAAYEEENINNLIEFIVNNEGNES